MRQSEVKKTRIGQGSTSPLRLLLLTSLISSRGSSSSSCSFTSCSLLLLLTLPLLILQQPKGVQGQEESSLSVAAIGSNGTSSSVEISGVCNDLLPDCTLRGVNGECDADPANMLVNCPSTCGSCLPTSEADCVDKGDSDSCFLGAILGECIANPSYYLRFCSSSCSELLPVCSLQTRDFGEACLEQSRSLTTPNFDCGKDFEIIARRETRSASVFGGSSDKKFGNGHRVGIEAMRKSLQRRVRNGPPRSLLRMSSKLPNRKRFLLREKRKKRKKGKRHNMKRVHQKEMKIPSFMMATDLMDPESSSIKTNKTQEIYKITSLTTKSSLVFSQHKEHSSANDNREKTESLLRQDSTSDVPTSTNIIVEILPTKTVTSTVATNTITITEEGSIATKSTVTSLIALSSSIFTTTTSFETVTMCTDDFTMPQSILSLISSLGPIKTIVTQQISSLVLLSSTIFTETIGRADLEFSSDLVSSFMMQKRLLSGLNPVSRNFINPSSVIVSPASQFPSTSPFEKDTDDISLTGTQNEFQDIQFIDPEWQKAIISTITSSVIVAHTIYTSCEIPEVEDQRCSVYSKQDGSCEVMPSDIGYCDLPCAQNCSVVVIKGEQCNMNEEECQSTTINVDKCRKNANEMCLNTTVLIDSCKNNSLNECPDLILEVGNNTGIDMACPTPTIDFNNCESTNDVKCSIVKVMSVSRRDYNLKFSQLDCFSIQLDNDDICETIVTDEVRCLDIVFGESLCPSISNDNGDCTTISSKENRTLSIIPVICESPDTTPATTPSLTTPEITLTTPSMAPTTQDPTTPNPTTPDPAPTPTNPSTSSVGSTNQTISPPVTETDSPTTIIDIPNTTESPATPVDPTTNPPTTSIILPSTDPPVTAMPPTTIAPDETTEPEEFLTPETIAALTIASTVISIIMSQTNISLFQQILQQIFQAILQLILQNSMNNQDNDDDDDIQNDNTDNNDNSDNDDNNDNNSDSNDNNNDQGNNQGSSQGDGQGSSGSQNPQQPSSGGGGLPSSSDDGAAAALIPNCDANGYLSLVDELGSLVGKNTGKPLSPDAFDVVEALNFCQHGGSGTVPSKAEDISIPEAELVPPPEWLGLSSSINIAPRNKRRTTIQQKLAHGHQNTPISSKFSSLFKPPVIEYGGWIPLIYPHKQSIQHRKTQHTNSVEINSSSKLTRPKRKPQDFSAKSREVILIIANDLYLPPTEPLLKGDLQTSLHKTPSGAFIKGPHPIHPMTSLLEFSSDILNSTLTTPLLVPSSTELPNSLHYVPPNITQKLPPSQGFGDSDSTQSGFDIPSQNVTQTVSFTTEIVSFTSLPFNMTNDDPREGPGPAAIGFAPDEPMEEIAPTESDGRGEDIQEEEDQEDDESDETELTRNIFYCGGTLITQKHILTAAHCVIPRKPNVIRLGERDFSQSNESRTVDYRVKRIAVNPGYKFPVKYNDIAVITLEEAIPLNSGLVPSCVPSSPLQLFEGQVATVSGWGTRANDEASDILTDVEVRVRSLLQCNESYSTLGEMFTLHYPEGLISNMLCAGGDEGQDVCRGDSGGPLFLQDILQVAGVVSAGYGCGDVNFPGLYTRVDSFLAWIDLAVYGRCASPIR